MNGSGKYAPPATPAWGLNSAGKGCQGHQLALKGHTAPLSKEYVYHPTPCPAYFVSADASMSFRPALRPQGRFSRSLGFNGGAITSLQQTEPCIYPTSPSTFIVDWRPIGQRTGLFNRHGYERIQGWTEFRFYDTGTLTETESNSLLHSDKRGGFGKLLLISVSGSCHNLTNRHK